MLPTRNPILATGISPAIFLGASPSNSSVATFAIPGNVVAGDLAIVITQNATVTDSGWTNLGVSTYDHSSVRMYYKQLSSADITATVINISGTGADGGAMFFRGGTVVTVKSQNINNSTSPVTSDTITGWTKAALCRRIFYMSVARTSITAGAPSGFTERYNSAVSGWGSKGGEAAPSSYTNGASIVVPGFSGSNGSCSYGLEIT